MFKQDNHANLLLKQAGCLDGDPRGVDRSGLIGVRQRAMQASASGGEVFLRNSCRQISTALGENSLQLFFPNFSRIEAWKAINAVKL